MHASYLLAFAAVVMGCTNPDSNSCASFIKSQAATASPFCASFTRTTYTATTGLPSWASNCSNKPKEISKECSCHWAGAAPTTFTTTQGSGPTATTTNPGPTTSAGNGGGGGGSCGSSGVNQLVGYAAGVTGGGSGSGTTVTSCSALQSAVSAGGVIRINGFLSGCGIIDLESNTSILGVGSGSGLTGGGFRIKDASNVIIRNLRFSVAVSKGDLLALDGATRVWIDHNDFSSRGITGGKDDYDGLLDITHASDDVTVSWNKFHDHWKGSLIGHSDSNSSEDKGKLKVTYHHNYWSNINSRLPSLRFGTGHIYNSCFENNPTSGINSRMEANVLVENSHFVNTPRAIVTNLDSDLEGYATSSGNIFENSSTELTRSSSYRPPYSYTLDPASCTCANVKSNAGTGIISV